MLEFEEDLFYNVADKNCGGPGDRPLEGSWPRAAYRPGGAGDSAQLRQHRPHLRRHRQPPPPGGAPGIRRVGLFFGRETAGLPLAFRERHRDRCVRLPMVSGARSLNLANSAAILVYEALRQNGFPGLTGTGEMA